MIGKKRSEMFVKGRLMSIWMAKSELGNAQRLVREFGASDQGPRGANKGG